MTFFPLTDHKDPEPMVVVYKPPVVSTLFPSSAARAESNRGKLRDILLDTMEERDNVSVHFETGAGDVIEHPSEHGSISELIDRDGQSLGEFDLVIDAMGLHSPLRGYRVDDDEGIHYSGMVMIHGVVDPSNFSPALSDRVAPYGSFFTMGRGYSFTLQEFGAGRDDHRRSLMYMVPSAGGEELVFDAIGIEKPTSRESGIMTGERLVKVQEWLKADMGDVMDPLYHNAVDCLERVTVRGNFTHGPSSRLKEDLSLPLVCIGDAPRNCGLGGGGTLAMHDAIELSQLLVAEGAFDATTGRVVLPPLREAEKVMMARKVDHMEGRDRYKHVVYGERDVSRTPAFEWSDFFPSTFSRIVAQALLIPLGALMRRWHRIDYANGVSGCDENSPIYPNVQKILDEQKQQELNEQKFRE
jgi:hypothetical protein